MAYSSKPSDKGKPKQLTEEEKSFYHGFAVVVADLIRLFDQPSMAVDIMNSNGVSLDDLKKAGTESFDLKPLTRAWKERK